MHPRIREIVDQSFFLRKTVVEVSTLLPAGDAELDDWLAQAIADKDSMLFLFLVVAAMHVERGAASSHLGRGLHLIADQNLMTMTAWRARGDDVPERVLDALRNTAIRPVNQAALLFIAAEWCKEHRNGEFPPDLLTEARLRARKREDLDPMSLGYLIALARVVDDQRILDRLLSNMHSRDGHKDLIEAGCVIGRTLRKICCDPVGDILREEAVHQISGYTVRRSVGHIGRNEPCPCGSGRKYKRCCFEKDAERLQHSTDIAGKTYAEIAAAPEQYLDQARLMKALPVDLSRMDPLKMDADLVGPFFLRLCAFRMWEELLTGLETVGWAPEFDVAWMACLFISTREGRKDVVERLLALRRMVEDPPYLEPPPDYVRLLLVRDDPVAFLKVLGEITTDSADANHFICSHDTALALLFSPFPALGILLGRGVIPFADKELAVSLLDEMLIVREKLGLSPDEPASDLLDKRFANEAIASGVRETEKLREARQKLKTKAEEVRRMQTSLDQLRAEVERREKKGAAKAADAKPAATPAAPVDAETLRELREKVATLKSTLKERHTERAALRRDLSKTLTELETLREAKSQPAETARPPEDPEEHLLLPGEVDGNQPVRVIELPKKFHHTLTHHPRQVARGALVLLGRLAAGEPDAFVGVVRLKQRPDTLRARIGIDHRLLFRLEAETVQVVDLISRQDLERRIKTL